LYSLYEEMNINSQNATPDVAWRSTADHRPILIVPYMWIGDFVRCHSVVKLLKARFPARPVDVLSTTLCAPLADYMPGLRQAIVVDLPRGRLSFAAQRALAARLRRGDYGSVLIMPRTWKAALAPFLAGIPQRIGWLGEWRFGLINDVRYGERKLPRMVDRCARLALLAHETPPPDWPLPELRVPAVEVAGWRQRNGLTEDRPVVALAPGAVGPSKRWPAAAYADLARRLAAEGASIWVLGGPAEAPLARIIADVGPHVRDLSGTDLRNAIIALAGADVAISNDSGLLHVAAALGTPSIGIFGPTSPWHWAPLNPLAATIETTTELPCQPCHKPTCRLLHHRCMRDITTEQVLVATRQALASR
jgi:heptosyltransferase-2